jgi:pimeloyl-ACP methyl ester carboxylesterase
MVITGVADRLAERISTLVYLDALVPTDGSTLFTIRPEYLSRFVAKLAAEGGLMVSPNPASAFDTATPADWAWIDSKTTAHPFACFAQSIRLTGEVLRVKRRIYIYAEGGICDGMYDVFRGDASAEVVGVAGSGHSIMIDQPRRLAEILQRGGLRKCQSVIC